MNNAPDWNMLRTMLAVVETGSLLAASKSLKLSQPTVGRHIAELEEAFGTVLFERRGRGLVPTPKAQLVADSIRSMASAASDASRAARGANQSEEGSIRISASQPIAYDVLPAILAKMQKRYPKICIDLHVSNNTSNLLQREADIAIRMTDPQQTDIIAKRLTTVMLGAFAHESYLQQHGCPTKPEDLLGHHILVNEDPKMVRRLVKLGLSEHDFPFRSSDLIAYFNAIQAGMGIGIISLHLARHNPSLVRILPQLELPDMPLWLLVHRELYSNRAIAAAYRFLAAEIPKALP